MQTPKHSPAARISHTAQGIVAMGACCDFSDSCNELAEVDCVGAYLGDGTTCGLETCLGACCTSTGCHVISSADCFSVVGNVFHGAGSSCAPDPCQVNIGACCDSGTCVQRPQLECAGPFAGVGTLCASSECIGACCVGDGSCLSDTTQGDCTGTWVGFGTSCTSSTCPQNDTCDNAEPIDVGGDIEANNDNSVDDNTGNCGTSSPSRGVWYRVTGNGERLTASTCNTDFDTKIQVFCNCPGQGCIGGNDNASCGVGSQVSWCSQSGKVYYLLVGGNGEHGTFDLSISTSGACGPAAPCSGATGACCTVFIESSCTDNVSAEECTLSYETFSPGIACADVVCEAGGPGACCFDDPNHACIDNIDGDNCPSPLFATHYPGQTCADIGCSLGNAGACCTVSGCSILSSDLCASVGAYVGDGSTCEGNPCGTASGACCFADGLCGLMTPAQCTGVFQGSGTNCSPNLCPQPTGACCSVEGDCTVTTVPDCMGSYLGDGTTCSPNHCTQPPGACCLSNGTCTVVHQGLCEGLFLGSGTLCDLDPCPGGPVGACCGGAFTICTVIDNFGCAINGGTYAGDGTNCFSNPCTGACCAGNGTCSETQGGNCAGTYLGDASVCTPNPCGLTTGACCYSDGVCSEGPQSECSGVFQGSRSTCDPNLCPQPTGACCSPEGVCSISTVPDCIGAYQGDGSDCSPNPCVQQRGACCGPNGSCTFTFAGLCEFTFLGGGTTCTPNLCPEPTGPCCGGVYLQCTIVDPITCAINGGTYGGDGFSCNSAPCLGACCPGDGSCFISTQDDCSGSFQGDATTCESDPCPEPTGACCLATGGCSVLTSSECTDFEGEFRGVGTICATACVVRQIVSSNPTHCTIDARVPFPAGQPGQRRGFEFIQLTFDGPAGAGEDDAADYTVFQIPVTTPPNPPSINSVVVLANTVTIGFSEPVQPRRWTCVRHNSSGTQMCVGFLPGDANSDRSAVPADILVLVDNLNGVRVPPLLTHQCDIDRSNQCAPADIISEIDLLNGANLFPQANGTQLEQCLDVHP